MSYICFKFNTTGAKMGRHKKLLSPDVYGKINSDLNRIPDHELIFKLTALKAASTNKQIDVANMYGISRSTLQNWARAYKYHGIEGLKPKPKGHNPSKLSASEKDTLRNWIINCSDNSGKKAHWTLRRLKKEILTVFGKEVGKTPLWISLKKMGLSLKKPRPKHYKPDPDLQDSFKKNSSIDR
jgi:transposase